VRVTKYSHSCIRIERDGSVLVVDPGAFSERAALDGVDAVLVTHEHFDHLDIDALTEAVAARPSVAFFAHADVLPKVAQLGVTATAVEPGQSFTAAGLDVRAFGGQHAVIHPEIPRVANLGYLITDGDTNLYHPGDSFTAPDGVAVDILFVPIAAPWLKISESIDFVRAVKPRRAFALHDALLTEAGAKIADTHLARLGGADYARLAPGASVD
jgi:L-ascorbate metabolism protein UlaG (beta-lactamase superfamily)